MIEHDVVQRILDTSQIMDVVQDYVTLRKRGVNYLGLCPFHHEKTPSFTVSPAKGIFKCFGCGEAGNSVQFVMKHEHLTYPDALRFLAKKYSIEITEKPLSNEDLILERVRESLLVVTAFAQKFFTDTLHQHLEGKNIGLSYFKERGFTQQIIEKFQLGYSIEQRDAFTKEALNKGYKLEFLDKTGLSIVKDDYKFDRFHGRVMFPIHSLSGRVVAFGGRILKADKTIAKYLNSPESEIYHKSDILYGIFFAKNAIVKNDKCFMVEGYTDMISMFQAGIENVVASSGTSLTINQIRLVKRFTQNLTILYDGDAAGIKASLRGIDLVLEEGMNVKVVPLPDGEDPDSFSKLLSRTELLEYIDKNEQNFITFKTRILLADAQNDPIKKAGLVNDIVKSISIIPDSVLRSIYLKECGDMLGVKEQALYDEANKIILNRIEDDRRKKNLNYSDYKPAVVKTHLPSFISELYSESEEKEIVFFLLNFGNEVFHTFLNDLEQTVSISVAEYIISEIINESLEFNNLVYKKIFEIYREQMISYTHVDVRNFSNHEDENIRQLTAHLLSESYTPSKLWEKQGSTVETPQTTFKKDIPKTLNTYKLKIVQMAIEQTDNEIKKMKSETEYDQVVEIIQKKMILNELKKQLAIEVGFRIIL